MVFMLLDLWLFLIWWESTDCHSDAIHEFEFELVWAGKILSSMGGEGGVMDGVVNGGTNGTHGRPVEEEFLPPPPPLPPQHNFVDSRESATTISAALSITGTANGPQGERDDIFEGVGSEYVPTVREAQSPVSEDMEESPRDNDRQSYFNEPYGPAPPPHDLRQGWEHEVKFFIYPCAVIVNLLIL